MKYEIELFVEGAWVKSNGELFDTEEQAEEAASAYYLITGSHFDSSGPAQTRVVPILGPGKTYKEASDELNKSLAANGSGSLPLGASSTGYPIGRCIGELPKGMLRTNIGKFEAEEVHVSNATDRMNELHASGYRVVYMSEPIIDTYVIGYQKKV